MAKKKAPTAPTILAPTRVRLHRLDAVGGFIELTPEHAGRLLALEAAMNTRNYAPDTDNAGLSDDPTDLEG